MAAQEYRVYGTFTDSSNYERLAIGGDGSITAENAGTGSAVDLTLSASGNIIMSGLPTSDPTVAGALWNNSGVLTVSAG
jgi:hypothetical protein